MIWMSCVLASMGTSIVTCLFVEAYQQRRASEEGR